ncbi:glycoside hydrolase family 92 protein [Chitinophaga silvatica]|uniref:Glycoside hydrolase family 92 protein n=1 Tax=Chitinophaga silvatica TaxID=2282649 RepID=A0A3E1YB09_9BACT|nr:GH92 family glycosyl hydrolase [Chitinophaga silvatica]RFS23024.1 glycoside hydrolase family 92 protein [Chitinophaga silvatica]
MYPVFKIGSAALLSSSLLISNLAGAQQKLSPLPGAKESQLLANVDPYIGSGGHGHVFVGASVPFGAVQVGPTNIVKGWDWCSGYHYSDSVVVGFPQLHLSGTGIGDLGDVLIMPYTGAVRTEKGTQTNPTSGYGSHYSHDREIARPGYYAVQLDDYNIKVELTASERVGFHRYTFPKQGQSNIIIDLNEGIGWDAPVETFIKKVDDYTLEGYRYSKGWAADQRVWFTIKSSAPIKKFLVFDNNTAKEGTEVKAKQAKGVIVFEKSPGEVKLKVGISPVSSANALANITAEIPDWDFTKVVNAANAKWEKELSRIQISTKDAAARRVFYTAFYHSMIAPALFNDHNGAYRGTDKKEYSNPGFNNYSVFSLWDVYRSWAALNTIVHPEKVSDFVNTMLTIHKQQGKLPVWHLMGNETNCMVGYHAVPLIADAFLKGFKGFDANTAFEAMKTTSNRDEFGLKYVKELGYIPADKEYESVSKAMEYAIDDWCIAAVAKKLGKQEDYEYYKKRAGYYKNYFDSSIKFVRPRLSDGSFKTPYDPFNSVHEKGDFTEGNGWQYTWLVPQDVEGLIQLMGGDEAFTRKLDSLFTAKGDMGAEASSDISGLIGMYAHGNEPSHHVTYMYAFSGYQWKTAEKVRQVMKEFYFDQPEGLAGNEDCGAMSSWYIFSSIGFYPENPASGIYVIGSPLFDKSTMNVGNGKTFTVEAQNNSADNIYIQSITLNGKPYTKSYIKHSDLAKGGNMVIKMGNKPNLDFGKALADRPTNEL